MATLAEMMQELEQLRHSRAVWMETVEHLAQFIDKDTVKADRGIHAEGCSVNPVPQTVVREFIGYINQQEIAPLNKKIEAIESLSIVETKNDKDPKGKAGTTRGHAEKKTDGGPKIGGSGKEIRAVPKLPGIKAQGVC